MTRLRREFSAKVKGQAFERADGRCENCTAYLFAGKYHYDHRIADALTGDNTLENCQVLCTACHAEKTQGNDIPRIVKARHQKHKHIGAQAPSKRPLPGNRNSAWRQKIGGKWERRT